MLRMENGYLACVKADGFLPGNDRSECVSSVSMTSSILVPSLAT